MPLDLVKSNIEREKEILDEIINLSKQIGKLEPTQESVADKKVIKDSMDGLKGELEVINNALPDLVNNIQFYRDLDSKPKKSSSVRGISRIRYNQPGKDKKPRELGIKKKEQTKFLEKITKKHEANKKLKEKVIKTKERTSKEKLLSSYIRMSNKFFRKTSDGLVEKRLLDSLNQDLRKISSQYIIQSYFSIALFTSFLALIVGTVLFIPIILFGNPILAFLILLGLPLGVFSFFFLYPSSERVNLEKEINQELPFVAIYMASVATSGIEPTKIFSILIRTKDYPSTQREIKKLMNYINFYGYDLVSALRHSSKTSPSERLSLLFNGLATTIRGGGELTDFLNKHSESLLFDYRLEREKYTKLAETFMDIYISILIAAPMIMMILFILLSLTGYGGGLFTPAFLSVGIIGVISLLNIGFIMFLNTKQPKF